MKKEIKLKGRKKDIGIEHKSIHYKSLGETEDGEIAYLVTLEGGHKYMTQAKSENDLKKQLDDLHKKFNK